MKIDFITHVGYGRTATTFLQKYFNNLNNTLFINGVSNKGKNISNRQLNNLLSKLIKNYKQYAVKGFANPSRSSTRLINEFTKELAKQIKKNKPKKVIISNETIGDYGNSIGEWNIFLQIAIGNFLEKKFKGTSYKIKKNMCFTIRNQVDILKSLIGYGKNIDVKNLDDFLHKFGDRPSESWLGGYYYYSNINLFETVSGKSWKFNVVPYEILSIDKDPIKYFRYVTNSSIINNKLFNLKKRVNSNSLPQRSEEKIYQERNIFTILGMRVIIENKSFYLEAKKRKLFISKFLSIIFLIFGKSLNLIGYTIIKINTFFNIKSIITVKSSADTVEKIQKMYAEDNKLLFKYISKNNLIKYGYIKKN